jgi:hypothetical protein
MWRQSRNMKIKRWCFFHRKCVKVLLHHFLSYT